MESSSVPRLKVVGVAEPEVVEGARHKPSSGHEGLGTNKGTATYSGEEPTVLRYAFIVVCAAAAIGVTVWHFYDDLAELTQPRAKTTRNVADKTAEFRDQREDDARIATGPAIAKPKAVNHRAETVYFITVREQQGTKCERPNFVAERGPFSFGCYELDVAAEGPSGHLSDFKIRAMKAGKDLKGICKGIGREQDREVLVYVHGFKGGHEDSIRKAAQFVHNVDYPGAVFVFSWPSLGQFSKAAYEADQKVISKCVRDFCRCLQQLCQKFKTSRIQIVAHSMGCRLICKTAVAMGEDDKSKDLRLGNVILASPDMDAEPFNKQFAPSLLRLAERVTVYYSRCDPLLMLGEFYNEGRKRLGRVGLDTDGNSRIEAVNFSAMGCNRMTHSFFRVHTVLLMDIRGVLAGTIPYSHRQLLDPN